MMEYRHQLPPLPFAQDALAPFLSKETFEYHYGRHHRTYVINLNLVIKDSEYENLDLEAIIRKAPPGVVYNNAAQVWNHSFFWNCLDPNGGGEPTGALAQAIDRKWGSLDEFKKAFQGAAVNNFGSGWTWLVKKADQSVDIVNMGPAGTPLTTDDKALLCIDVWEHAYYLDYQNQRAKYVEVFFDRLVNWRFAEKNFDA
jgi:Fe-Mn family superoxide dismutase